MFGSQPPMRKLPRFPIRVTRHGFTVNIYRQQPRSKYVSFVLSYYLNGVRKRPTFSRFEDAKREAELVALKLATREADVLQLHSDDRIVYIRAKKLLEPLGISLDVAISEYCHAKKVLGTSGTLLDAIHYYAKSKRAIATSRRGRRGNRL